MATGDIVNVTIKDGAGIDRQMPFEEQADGSLAPVHYARGPEGGAILARLSGSTLAEQQTEADAVTGTLTFSADLEYVEIYNTDATNDGVFTINGIAVNVPADEVWSGKVGGTAGDTVDVTGATSYIVSRYT